MGKNYHLSFSRYQCVTHYKLGNCVKSISLCWYPFRITIELICNTIERFVIIYRFY